MKPKQRSLRSGIGMALLALTALVLTVVMAGAMLMHSLFPRKYSQLVEKYAAEYDLDPALIYAVIKTESDFNPEAVSVDDACGLMQMLPDTFEWMQRHRPGERAYVREDLFDPEISIEYGAFFLDMLVERFGSVELAAAAYHAGPAAVDRWLQDPDYSPDGQVLEEIPYRDTAHYVKKITFYHAIYLRLLREKT